MSAADGLIEDLSLPTGQAVGEHDNLHLAARLHWPREPHPSGLWFYCLPGGGMQRDYYDLPTDDASFSFARTLAAAGYPCVLVDHPGVGESDRPSDSYLLNPDRVCELHAAAVRQISQLKPALVAGQSIGVGHSMGAMLSLRQQSLYGQHRALLLMGFGFDGLPQYLPPAVKTRLVAGEGLRADLPHLARQMFRVDYPVIRGGGQEGAESGDLYAVAKADPAAREAIKQVSAALLPVPAFASMLPGFWNADAANIEVPVLLALGDKDLAKVPDNPDMTFSASPSVDTLVLPDTGHSQFLFASRHQLYQRLSQWLEQIEEGETA